MSLIFIFSSVVQADGHVGCVTFYDKSLCETDSTIQYKSDTLAWEWSKDHFKTELISFLDYKIPGHAAKMATVFLWVSDFDSHSALRVQVWSDDRSVLLSLPIDIEHVDKTSDVLLRLAGSTPYPVDFGYTPGEILILCQTDCTPDHLSWLRAAGLIDVQSLLPRALVVNVPSFTERATVDNLKLHPEFNRFFSSVELSPVLEGNGYRELAFTVYF